MNPSIETEQCRVGFELHSSDLEDGSFRGMASVFNTMIDTFVPTIIDPGAFKNTLQNHDRNVVILWQHDDTNPIGTPTEMWETKHGLEIVGKISSTQQGKDALTLMRDGVVTEMSIGFDPVSFRFEEEGKDKALVRHVDEVVYGRSRWFHSEQTRKRRSPKFSLRCCLRYARTLRSRRS